MNDSGLHIGADAEISARLGRLLGGSDRPGADRPEGGEPGAGARNAVASEAGPLDPAVADALLARVVWSRLVEPGDATAGSLIAALGPGPALDLVASRAGARRICDAVRASGEPVDGVDPRRIAAGVERWLPRLDRAATLADLDRGITAGMRVIAPDDGAWPARLDDLGAHAPLLLWVRGDPAHLSSASLAVVGARACTGYGSHVTAELTEAACSAGASIVSGAAYGIDAVAHRTALAADTPTIAVVAGGADRPYPSAHAALLQRIVETGAVCSEMAPGSAPTRWRFLMRNRVIAALSLATLVTEAGARSGSINTAGNAAELGRPLGAVPGPVTSAASSGCHRLIRDYGAMLIANAEHLRDLLGLDDGVGDGFSAGIGGGTGEGGNLDGGSTSGGDAERGGGRSGLGGERERPVHRRVLDALPLRGSRDADEVARRAGLSPQEARGALAELELLGRVARRETPGSAEAAWALQRRE